MDNMKKETCTQCKERCPVDALQCGKGQRYFEQLKASAQSGGTEYNSEENESRRERGSHEGRREHGERGGREERREHGERGGREERREHGERGGREERREHGERGGHEGRREHSEHQGREHGDHSGYSWNVGRDGGNGHEHAEHAEDSVSGLLCRCGYIADRKSGRHRGQKRILQILLASPRISQRELIDQLNIEPGSMSEVLAKLEDKGFIRREKDVNDRRKMMITLTEEGREEAERYCGNMDEGILDVLSEEEKDSLKAILGKLLAQWQTERRAHGNYHCGKKDGQR